MSVRCADLWLEESVEVGKRALSTDSSQLTSALAKVSSPRWVDGESSTTSEELTGPKIQHNRSKKWNPMFMARPPERAGSPFQDTWYQGPRGVMYLRATCARGSAFDAKRCLSAMT